MNPTAIMSPIVKNTLRSYAQVIFTFENMVDMKLLTQKVMNTELKNSQ